jgi:hypothetical protein
MSPSKNIIFIVGRLLITLIPCLIFYGNCFAQVDSSSTTLIEVKHKIQALRSRHVDIIICYHSGCDGCFIKKGPDPCFASEVRYLFWGEKSKFFINRFDNCHKYNPARMDGQSFHDMIKTYLKLAKQKFKYPVKWSDSSGRDSTELFSAADDTPHAIFDFCSPEKRLRIDIDFSVFESKTGEFDQTTLELLKTLTELANNETNKYDKSIKP